MTGTVLIAFSSGRSFVSSSDSYQVGDVHGDYNLTLVLVSLAGLDGEGHADGREAKPVAHAEMVRNGSRSVHRDAGRGSRPRPGVDRSVSAHSAGDLAQSMRIQAPNGGGQWTTMVLTHTDFNVRE